jgi:predicted tellurium resistance membrane protein TerC
MDGIQILNETTRYTISGNGMFGIIICSVLTMLFLFFTVMALKDKEIGVGIGCLIIAIITGFGFFYSTNSYKYRTQYIEYQVTISDTVKMTEFNNRYKVISQEGKIYTIVEKDKE